jgi:TolA-binding protein
MTDELRATQRQWDQMTWLAKSNGDRHLHSVPLCLVELHQRLQALEEQVEENQTSSHFCNEQLVQRVEQLEWQLRSQSKTADFYQGNLRRRLTALEEAAKEAVETAASPSAGQGPELEVLVGKAMQEAPEDDGHRAWGGMSPAGRAAIYAVARWLESQGVGAGVAAARWIREDMERG